MAKLRQKDKHCLQPKTWSLGMTEVKYEGVVYVLCFVGWFFANVCLFGAYSTKQSRMASKCLLACHFQVEITSATKWFVCLRKQSPDPRCTVVSFKKRNGNPHLRKRKVRGESRTVLTSPGSSRVTKSSMLAEVSKYSGSNDPTPSAAEVKKKIRLSREELAGSSDEKAKSKIMKATVVEESVRFAGQTFTIQRALVPGSAEEQRYLRAQKRRSSAKLGGGLAALDKLLGISRDKELNTMEKSGLDWTRHKEEALWPVWVFRWFWDSTPWILQYPSIKNRFKKFGTLTRNLFISFSPIVGSVLQPSSPSIQSLQSHQIQKCLLGQIHFSDHLSYS